MLSACRHGDVSVAVVVQRSRRWAACTECEPWTTGGGPALTRCRSGTRRRTRPGSRPVTFPTLQIQCADWLLCQSQYHGSHWSFKSTSFLKVDINRVEKLKLTKMDDVSPPSPTVRKMKYFGCETRRPSLRCDWEVDQRYQGPAHTPT